MKIIHRVDQPEGSIGTAGGNGGGGNGASVREVFDRLGDHELAIVYVLDQTDDLDVASLASKARLRVSTADEAVENLHQLGLVEVSTDDEGHKHFRLERERLREQIESAPEALFA